MYQLSVFTGLGVVSVQPSRQRDHTKDGLKKGHMGSVAGTEATSGWAVALGDAGEGA